MSDAHNQAIAQIASITAMVAALLCYYYPTQQELDGAGDDLSNIDWVIYGYEVV